MDDNSGRKPRRGSARWRQQQRKERDIREQKQMATTSTTRQVKPAGGFKMPEIKLPTGVIRVAIYIVAAVLLVFGMIFTLRIFNPPEAIALPNAIWLNMNWSYDLPPNEEVIALTDQLRDNRIGTAYVWVTRMKEDFTWSGKTGDVNARGEVINTINPLTEEPYRNELAEMEPNILLFVNQFREAYPEGKLFGWVDLPVGTVALDDEELHTRTSELATLLVTTYGFDGVYINAAPVGDGDEGYLQLLRRVRLELDDVGDALNTETRIPLAVAIPPDWRPSDPTIPYNPSITAVFEWNREYKQNVVLLVDEMLLMTFNSGLTRPEDYSVWVAYQTKVYAEVVAELGVETEILIGVPTYPAALPFHDPTVENVETNITGVNSGLIQAGPAAETVRGLTIFGEWTTEPEEWGTFRTQWINPTTE